MPRKQSRPICKRQQNRMLVLKLNSERMKLIRAINTSSGDYKTNEATWRLLSASEALVDTVRRDLGRL